MSMNNKTIYIGVRGHRGSGKPTVSYMIAHIIDYIISNGKFNKDFDEFFNHLLKNIKYYKDDFILRSRLSNVYLESFSDFARLICAMILNINSDMMYNEYNKDNTLVNIDTMTIVDKNPIYDDKIINANDLFNIKINKSNKNTNIDKYITLREFCTYISLYCFQNLLCDDIWIKTLNNNKYIENDIRFKIFYDVKTPQEVSYIKENNGYIICVNRPKRKKNDTIVSNLLKNDNRIDYNITIDGDDILSCKNELMNISIELVNKLKTT